MKARAELRWNENTHELTSRSGRVLMVGSLDACAIAYLGVVISVRWRRRTPQYP